MRIDLWDLESKRWCWENDDFDSRQLMTTREVLNAEKQMIQFARDVRGTRKAISSFDREFELTWLNEEQKDAVNHVLQSRDTVMAITGGAGTGKSSLMQEAVEAVRENGKQVYTFAPSTGAKEVLEEKGFENANTVDLPTRTRTSISRIRASIPSNVKTTIPENG
ncbi:MAG: primosomal protein N' [Mariniblastus sp.]|jgi:primosomal protein N'